MLDYVSFRDEDHSYTRIVRDALGQEIRKPYISATTLIGKYKQKFPKEFMGYYKAFEEFMTLNGKKYEWYAHKRVLNDIPKEKRTQQIIEEYIRSVNENWLPFIEDIVPKYYTQWDNTRDIACAKGTAYHLYREKRAYEIGYESHVGANLTLDTQQNYYFNLAELPDGFYSELLVYNHTYEIAGQIDKAFITTRGNKRYISIDDFKTNREIKMDNKYDNMKYPVDHLPDCNYVHYQLQLSLYAWMLEQYGFQPDQLQFTWIKENKVYDDLGELQISFEEIPYHFNYMKKEVEDMLNHYHSNYLNNGINRDSTKVRQTHSS